MNSQVELSAIIDELGKRYCASLLTVSLATAMTNRGLQLTKKDIQERNLAARSVDRFWFDFGDDAAELTMRQIWRRHVEEQRHLRERVSVQSDLTRAIQRRTLASREKEVR